MKAIIVAGPLFLALAIFSACGGDDEEATPSPTAPLTASPSPTRAATATASPTLSPSPSPAESPFAGSQGPFEKVGNTPPQSVAVLENVRYARHVTFDRVVFDFRDGLPGYRIEYVQPPILQDGSAMPVEIDGDAFLQMRFNLAVAHDDNGQSTYTGPREIRPGLPSAVELEITGDFEGYVTWVLGAPERLDVRVTELTNPFRVVVDIAHP